MSDPDVIIELIVIIDFLIIIYDRENKLLVKPKLLDTLSWLIIL